MTKIIYKRIRSGKRKATVVIDKPQQYREYVTYEHSVERHHAGG